MKLRYVFSAGAVFLGIVVVSIVLLKDRGDVAPEPLAQSLQAADREFLWQAEHLGLLLTSQGWNPALKAIIERRDSAPLLTGLATEFHATWPENVDEITTGTVGLNAQTASVPSAASSELIDADTFIDRLSALRKRFGDEVRVHFKLLAVHPKDRQTPEGEWMGRGRITVSGTTTENKQRVAQLHISYVTTKPETENIRRGGWLRQCQITKQRFVESERSLFTDVTSDSAFAVGRLHDNWKRRDRQVNTGGVFLCDYNRDGCTDVLVTDITDFAGIILYRGSPSGEFFDVTVESGLPYMPGTMNAVFADLDGDGWEDLVVPDSGVFQNDRKGRFINVTRGSNLVGLVYAGGREAGLDAITGVSVADYDRDGLVDLYITRGDAHGFRNGSWIDGKSGHFTHNQLLHNSGDFQFQDVTTATGTKGGQRSVFTSVWLDANNDNWPDLYVINEFGAGLLLINRGGTTFDEVELDDHSSDFASMGLSCGDFNNDGLTDIYVSNMFSSAGNRVMDNLPKGHYDEAVTKKLRRMVAGNQLHMNAGDLQFRGRGPEFDVAQVGWGWGPALADFNNDGWLDIYATCGFMSHTRGDPDG